MAKRTITIVCDIDQPEADWIWKCHGEGKPFHGIMVNVIANGNLSEKVDELEAQLEELETRIDD